MICKVCGAEFSGVNTCPECQFPLITSIGKVSKEEEAVLEETVRKYKEKILKDIKVYVRGYHWEEENGQLVEKFHEDILIAENIGTLKAGQVSWSDVVFAKQAAGEKVDLTLVIEQPEKKEVSVHVIAPDTEKMWQVGLVIKPGLKASVRVGGKQMYADSTEFSLKG